MEYVDNVLQELLIMQINNHVIHFVLELIKFMMEKIVYVPLTSIESMEYALNV